MDAEARKTLVVLEEGNQITRLIREEATRRGYEVITYRDATGLLVMSRQLDADAVVIDAHLRGAGSVIAVKSFRRNVNLAATPVIALLARSGPAAEELSNAGVQACVPEGSDAKRILDAVKEHEQESLDFTQAPAEVLADEDRLAAVAQTGLVDSPPEPGFDRLTQLARALLVAPISLTTFVTDSRQFLKSQVGLAEPWATRRETPLSHSFCQWVVADGRALVVEDATTHRVLRENKAIQDLNVVAYAGMPVTGARGHSVGAMCAIDSRPRNWTPEDLATLQDLAVIASAHSHWTPERARDAIEASARTMRRYGPRLRDHERDGLLGVVEEQAGRLAPRAA